MKFIRRHPEIIILTIAALITRLWSLFTPAAVVFDEVYFKSYAGDYLTGSYYFDIHPPLGKLLLGAWAWLLHINPAMLIGTGPAVQLRIVPALAGALIIPVFYLFLRQLGASKRVSTLGAALLLLDNALLVESRFVLIDSLLILFGLSAVTCFLAARRHSGNSKINLLIASAILGGCAASTKWTGLTALGLVFFIWIIDQTISHHIAWTQRLSEGLILTLLPLLVYVSVFWVHFSLLPKTGSGDAFMSRQFQATLIGSSTYNPKAHMGFPAKFADLNRAMIESEASLKNATHPYGSKWYTWPLMLRPVYYWEGDTLANGAQGNIYLLGNPAIWWGILIIIAGSCLASPKALRRLRPYRFPLVILSAGYVLNFLPFSRIIRVMFLYHYFFALIYSLAIAVIMLGAIGDWATDGPTPWKFSSRLSRDLYIWVLGIAVVGFIYFAPLSYGIPLSPAELTQHMWLNSWR